MVGKSTSYRSGASISYIKGGAVLTTTEPSLSEIKKLHNRAVLYNGVPFLIDDNAAASR